MKTFKLIEVALGGISASNSRSSSLSSYSRDIDDFIKSHKEECEGAIVLDKVDALNNNKEAVKYVINGPMVNVDLGPGEKQLAPEIPEYMMAALQGGFQAIAQNEKINPGSLDYVDMQTHIKNWVNLGAKVGQVKNGKVEWDEH